MDLAEGEMSRVERASPSRFFLYREIPPLDSDGWNEERDKALATSSSARHLPGLHYGLVDLDGNGSWILDNDLGAVWKPKVAPGWTPFRDGQWLWYDELGYTWVANEPWGWLPFHYGRWMPQSGGGWVWTPGKSIIFKPGEAYWLREQNLVGWGPLAPGETWDARAVPKLYQRANTSLATWRENIRELVPGEPAEKLKPAEALFVVAPPSPAMDAARLEAVRPVLRAGSTRIVPVLPGVTYDGAGAPEVASVPPSPPVPGEPPGPPAPPDAGPPPQAPGPVQPPPDVYYPAPIYTGIIVVNPPDEHHHDRHDSPPPPPAQGSNPPSANNPVVHHEPTRVHPIEPGHPVEPHPVQPPVRHVDPVRTEPPVHNAEPPSRPSPPPHNVEPPSRPSQPSPPVHAAPHDAGSSGDKSAKTK